MSDFIFGVAGHREDKGIADRHQLIAVIFVLLFEERAVLEHVGVQFALVGGVVRQQRTAEADQLDVQPVFLFRHLPGDFRHVLFRAVDDADLDMVPIGFLLAALKRQNGGEGRRQRGDTPA